ncbi:family 43 glycosylhydrolase [Paenarthrobacter histidinolovorans]|uniref:Ricin B lectin domain-containing protein n=1 Tax=Paenarthrobacter histidinolovorans TaxID=43664 RepID=A0ABW8N9K2_9MICC
MLSNTNASSRHRIAAAIAASTLALATLPLLSPSTIPVAAAAGEALVLTPNPAQAGPAFKGWGTSLVWMANATGQYPEAIRNDLIDKVFGDDGLNLNIARYNVGGGNASDIPDYLRPGGAVPGWWNPNAGLSDQSGPITTNYADRDRFLAAWTGENASDYNFDADASQRAWIAAIKDKVTTWEAFSNSPPYFMTESGYVSGGTDPNADQIKPAAIGKFVNYVKKAAEHVEQTEGIHFDTINPLNEPNTNYWKTTIGGNGLPNGGGQEGAHAGPALQSQVLTAMAAELAEPGTTTDAKVSGPDETSPSRFLEDWNGWTPEAKQAVSQLNVHTYSTGDRLAVRDVAKATDKPLSMSEVEGNWGGDSWNPDSIENGLGMATRITDDLRELDPESWVLWQPVEDLYNMELGEKKNWGSVFIDFDCNAEGNSVRRLADGAADPSCRTKVNSKYNTIRNFTHYIAPGDRIIPTSDGKTTSALKADGSGLAMVHTNDSDQARTIKVDLSKFATIAAGATVTPVVTTESPSGNPTANALVSGTPVAVDAGSRSATLTVPAKSVTTFVINGASGVAANAPAVQDGQSYSFVGVQSGRAVTASEGSPKTVLSDSIAGGNQVWKATLIADEDGTTRDRFVLRLADGRALAADANGTALRTITDEEARTDSSAQWLFSTTDGTSFSLLNAGQGQVLDVSNQSTHEGAWIGLWTSNGGANQAFTLRNASEGTGYNSFRPGQDWRDNNGNLIQAHGGQVVTSKDSEGKTIYYLYGEDRTNGYHSSPGVHGYSSYDLYNWKDEGVVLKAMSSADQFTSDPYFQNLYSGYSTEQKNAVYRDLGTVPSGDRLPPILERPKVIYNKATNKWVMWVHADGPTDQYNVQYAKANAGVAISDSPFGPFRYIDSYRLHKAAAGDPTNFAPNNPGMARDMNLFVDDDGTGYIIYSSEENKTMFISKLNADYTNLSASPDTAVEGVDFRRAFVNVSRESPAIFKYQGRYFIITSGTTGWSPNPSEYGTSTSILGEWTQLPNPFSSDVAWNSNNSQPSSVIPVDAANGKFIYMGDRWNGGSDQALATAPMVWLPIQMGEGGKTLSVLSPSEWRLEDLDANAVWNVTGVPASLPVGADFNVNSVTVTQNGQSSTQPVTWQVSGNTNTVGVITATGTLPGFGNRTFTRTIPVVPNGVRYAVNAGGKQTADWTALMAAPGVAGATLNSAADQPYGVDPATGKTWGYQSEGSGVYGTADGDLFTTLRYAAGGRDLTYKFNDLAPGTYTVYAGYYDPWAQWDDRGAKVTVNGAVVEADHDYSGDYQSAAYQNVTVGTDGKLTFSLTPTRGPDVQLSWLMIANPVPAAPQLNVTAVASTKCVAGKVTVTAQLTNNDTKSVQATFTSSYGTKSFAEVKPGKNAVHAFTTRAASVPAGTVAVEAKATVNGQPVTVTANAAYNAASCN